MHANTYTVCGVMCVCAVCVLYACRCGACAHMWGMCMHVCAMCHVYGVWRACVWYMCMGVCAVCARECMHVCVYTVCEHGCVCRVCM